MGQWSAKGLLIQEFVQTELKCMNNPLGAVEIVNKTDETDETSIWMIIIASYIVAVFF